MATPDANDGPVLFLSHAGADTEAARRLKARLEAAPDARAAGLQVWFDKDNLRAGAPWQDQLEEAIKRHATAFAVYIGSKAVVNWVEAEVRLALSRAIISGGSFAFVPIIAAAADSAALPGFAQQFQAVRDVETNPEEFQKLLAAVLGQGEAVGQLKAETEPFFGLRAIDEERSHLFFGRETETCELIERLQLLGLLIVIGDSGSGKSSLVKAGLVPRWRGGALAELEGRRPDEEIWHVIELRPGRDPRRALGDAVFKAAGTLGRPAEDQGTYLKWATGDDPELRRQGLRCGLSPDKTRTLIVVDQFEELVTLAPKEQRQPFVELLLGLAEAGDPAFSIVLTMRRDYYNLLAAPECRSLYHLLEAQDRTALYRLGRMSDAGLRRIVIEPLQLAGVNRGERETLAESVLRDVGERPGDLALVQFALTRAWERQSEFGGSIVQAYASIGRVDGALAREAERIFKDVLGGEKNEAEVGSTLIRLARLEGTAGPTRRVARRKEFTDSRWSLLQTLADAKGNRLVLIRNPRSADGADPDVGEEIAEIAHEALLNRWPRLHAWLNDAPEDKRILDRLADRTAEWADAATPQAKDRLLARTDAERDAFDALARARPLWLSTEEQDFVAASVHDHQTRMRRDRWVRNAALVAAGVFLIASGLATWFWYEAGFERDKTRMQFLAAQARRVNAEADTPNEIGLAAALALESIQIAQKIHRSSEADAVEVSRSTVRRLPLHVQSHGTWVSSLVLLPDGRLATIGGEDGVIKLWPRDGSEPEVLTHGKHITTLKMLRDGRLASASVDGMIKLWHKDGGEPTVLSHSAPVSSMVLLPDGRLASSGGPNGVKLWPKGGGEPLVLSHPSPVSSLVVLPDGRLASSGGPKGVIQLWPNEGGEPEVLTHGSFIHTLVALPDGRLASCGDNGIVKLWPSNGGEPKLLSYGSIVSWLVVLPDGRLAGGNNDGVTKIWPSEDGEPEVFPHGAHVSSVVALPDGRIATGGADGLIKLWPNDGGEPEVLTHGSAIHTLVVLPDGRLSSGDRDGTIKFWPSISEPEVLRHGAWVTSLAVLPDGRLVSGGDDGVIKLWSKEGDEFEVLTHANSVQSLVVLRDGRLASGGFDDGVIKLWSNGGTEPEVITDAGSVWSLVVLSDGRLASGGGVNGTIRIWPRNGGTPKVITHGRQFSAPLAVLPDGRLASGDDGGVIKVWPRDGREPEVLTRGNSIRSLAVLPDGRFATSGAGNEDDVIKIWPKDGSEPEVLTHGSSILTLLVLPDGRLASSGSEDGVIKLWPRDGGEPEVLTHGSRVRALAALPDGRLASGSINGEIKLWLVDEEKLITSLCLRAGRNLTRSEWARYIGSDTPWQPSCRNRPSNWRTPDP